MQNMLTFLLHLVFSSKMYLHRQKIAKSTATGSEKSGIFIPV